MTPAFKIWRSIGRRGVTFYQPDHDFGLTVICTEPIADQRRRFFRHYPRWSESSAAHERPSPGPAAPPTAQYPDD